MGRVANYTIEKKKSIWFCPQEKQLLEMCLQNGYLDIAIWTTTLKQNITRVLRKLVSK
jgi:hypothetical protein